MRFLLIIIIAVFTVGDALTLDMSLGPGLSAKNAAIYIAAFFLVFRIVTRGGFRIEAPTVHIYFSVLIGYAILTYLVAAFIIGYQSYDPIVSGILIKNSWIDYFLVFLLFFYGTQSTEDTQIITKAIALSLSVSCFITIGNFFGLFKLGQIVIGTQGAEAGRLAGPYGNANDTGAFIVCLLPAYAAAAFSRRGFWSLFWIGAAMVSLIMLIMTESRGSIVGIVVGYGWALYVSRRYISVGKAMAWAGAGIVFLIFALLLAGPHFIDSLRERIFGQSGAIDLGQASSGRSDIWVGVVTRMMSTPITLITGFGWNAYSIMGFYLVPHNHYLGMWFDLGLVGVLSFIGIVQQIISTVRAAIDGASERTRTYLIAFVFGLAGLLVSIFFTLIYRSWSYIWAYAGVTLRMALISAANASTRRPDPAGRIG